VLRAWQNIIVNFNYSDPSLSNTYRLTVSMGTSTGFSASANVTAQTGGKPTQGSITINTGRDAIGSGWFLDPTPSFNGAFRGTILSPYVGVPTPGGPADGQGDFYSYVMAEMAHCMGLINSGSLLFTQDPNHYLTDSGQNDTVDSPGKLWTYNGPD